MIIQVEVYLMQYNRPKTNKNLNPNLQIQYKFKNGLILINGFIFKGQSVVAYAREKNLTQNLL